MTNPARTATAFFTRIQREYTLTDIEAIGTSLRHLDGRLRNGPNPIDTTGAWAM